MRSITANRFVVLVLVVLPFLATLLAIWLLWQRAVHWSDLILLASMYSLTVLGIGMGFHRMLTHHSYRAHPAVKVLLLLFGSMAIEGPALEWAATHLKHHANADQEGDPHSPVEGLFHAHLGWLLHDSDIDQRSYGDSLKNDSIVRFMSNTFILWVILSLILPFALGGFLGGSWSITGALYGLLWGGMVRIFLVHHVTWSVNSICHTFGKREFETKDRSRNEWVIGLLAFGEGWHNNHHAFPRSAFHGLRWWQFDLSGYLIRLLERTGLARDVYRVPVARQKSFQTIPQKLTEVRV